MDGTKDPKDALGATPDPSAGEKGTPKEPETFTGEQVNKRVSDALSKAGRDAKTLGELQQRLDKGMAELTSKQAAWQKEKDEAEEEAVRDNPEALTALRTERKKKTDEAVKATELTERESKLTKRETELADIVERDRILTRTQLAAEVAVEKKVSIDGILKGIVLSKDDSREAMEAIAELLPKTAEAPLLPDSSRTIGGGGWDTSQHTTKENIEEGIRRLTKK